MAKLKIEWEEDDYEFDLIGICSTNSDYRLCWEINIVFDINLRRGEDYSLKNKKEDEYYFSFYEFVNNDTYEEFYLIKNQSFNYKKLIPEQDKIDYFLVVKNGYSYSVNELLIKLKKLNGVLTAFSFEVEELKSKSNLIF